MRYAVFGGSFDPPHLGHVQVVRDLCQEYDEVLVCAASSNWTKASPFLPLEDRRALLGRALVEEDRAVVDDYDYAYTIDLVQHLTQTLGPDTQIDLVIGDDLVGQMDRWRGIDELRKRCTIKVVPRGALSSTLVREAFNRKDLDYVRQICPQNVYEYLDSIKDLY